MEKQKARKLTAKKFSVFLTWILSFFILFFIEFKYATVIILFLFIRFLYYGSKTSKIRYKIVYWGTILLLATIHGMLGLELAWWHSLIALVIAHYITFTFKSFTNNVHIGKLINIPDTDEFQALIMKGKYNYKVEGYLYKIEDGVKKNIPQKISKTQLLLFLNDKIKEFDSFVQSNQDKTVESNRIEFDEIYKNAQDIRLVLNLISHQKVSN